MGSDTVGMLRDFGWDNLLGILLILGVAVGLTWLIQRFIPRLAGQLPGRYRLPVMATVPLLRLVILVAAIALIVPIVIQPTFENLVAFLGAAGLALGFALKDYASSLIAGIVVVYEAAYRPGDWISVEGGYGEVRSVGMRYMTMVTPDDTVVVVPHLKLWTELIYNDNDGTQNIQCVTNFYLDPEHAAGQARQVLYDVALTSPYAQVTKPIAVIVQEKPWGTHYRLKAYPVDPRDQFQFTTDLTVRGKEVLHDLGLQPARTSALPDGAAA
ncbi:MAG: mechanosensitive ion channel [Spiribacter salinus]|uniref:Small-conductance mechanosensitive channel n=1 Tax=Spiribacter salinus TaxID=1335746 RepID=A0A540VKJ7_9GAMM|nr:MAG: mechanosensitive ion channel [Spiribacter salinus]